jgi:predicted GTPase
MARVVILGAGGRDFHNFNVYFRRRAEDHGVAFTATQIPNIANRVYPPSLAGPRYPHGVPIVAEEQLGALIRRERVDEVVFAYSDVSHNKPAVRVTYAWEQRVGPPLEALVAARLTPGAAQARSEADK